MSDQTAALLDRHRNRGVIVDTNLLLVALIGSLDPRLVEKFKRTRGYSRNDVRILAKAIELLAPIVTTPHIAAETSNLAGHLEGDHRGRFFAQFALWIREMLEVQDSLADIGGEPVFVLTRFGITDVAVMRSAASYLVLTDDGNLAQGLRERSRDVIEFRQLRELG